MALKILESCINCDMCEPECPNKAISMGEATYVIDPERCTECVGYYDAPTCVSVCPIDCIITDPEREEDHATLYAKFVKLVHAESEGD